MSFISKIVIRPVLAAVAGLSLLGAAQAADISGAGATFPYPVYAKWASTYKQTTGTGLNYQSIGSGGGIKQIKAKTVTFGASDMPLKEEDLRDGGLVQWPMIMGGAVPAINVEGIQPGQLVLDGPTLAKIYMGEIKTWNDAAIAKLNAGLKLPATPIAAVYRSDGSGTNFLFSDYLSKVSADFKAKIGANSSVQWPVGIGAKGNEGVANMVKQTVGAIGYVEYAYVKQNNMNFAALVNAAGNKVKPESKSFQAAAASANWAGTPGYGVVLTNQPGADAWPITGASFILMHAQPQDAAAAGEALKFFDWAYKSGGAAAEALDYVPMPDSVAQMVRQTWSATIKSGDGKAIFVGM